MSDEKKQPAGVGTPVSGGSQIKAIANGVAAKTKRYWIRSQPTGPTFDVARGNAARLTAVPASAEEKYRGGLDE